MAGVDVAALHRAVDELFDDAVNMLKDLVRIPSLVNTPGEKGVQEYMAAALESIPGLSVDKWNAELESIKDHPDFAPIWGKWEDKICVVATHQPRNATGKSLMFNGHMDIVPTGLEHLWTSPPYEPAVREGRLYGRGVGDMKAGVVAFVMAFKALRKLGFAPAARVHLTTVIDEESTGNGSLAVLQKGYTADACIIPEPFSEIMTAQIGVIWLQLVVSGKPAHMLQASSGANAIESAIFLWGGLQELEAQWNQPDRRHEMYKDFAHPLKFNLGKIEGGEWASTVPAECTMHIRVGFFPGRTVAEVRAELESVLSARAAIRGGIPFRVVYKGFSAPGCVVTKGDMLSTLADSVTAVRRHVRDESPPVYAPVCCTTDVWHYEAAGIPTTCLGPQYTRNIHGTDESISLDSFREIMKVFAVFMTTWCGVEPVTVE